MPRAEDNRRLVRHAAQLPLVYRLPGGRGHHAETGWTRDLSAGGIGLDLPERLRKYARLTLRLGTALGTVRAEGQVLWVGLPTTPSGGTPHGITFTELPPTHQTLLQELLRALARAPHAASRLPLDLPVRCQAKDPDGPALRGRTLNVGRGGLALQLPVALVPGAEVALTLQAARQPLTVEAVIAWVEAERRRLPTGPITHGLQFTGLDWALARPLGALLMETG
jgi:hypothetical protein